MGGKAEYPLRSGMNKGYEEIGCSSGFRSGCPEGCVCVCVNGDFEKSVKKPKQKSMRMDSGKVDRIATVTRRVLQRNRHNCCACERASFKSFKSGHVVGSTSEALANPTQDGTLSRATATL